MSFQIYDFDGDGMINTRDLTIVVRATMREQDIVMHKGRYSLASNTLTDDTVIFFVSFYC